MAGVRLGLVQRHITRDQVVDDFGCLRVVIAQDEATVFHRLNEVGPGLGGSTFDSRLSTTTVRTVD